MFIADKVQKIRNTEVAEEIRDGMIEKLDQMLTEYGVQHFFTLPEGDNDGIAIDDSEVVYVYYENKDDVVFSLVYMLWSKSQRNVSDELILKAMNKMSNK